MELTEYHQGPRTRRGSERRAAEGYCDQLRIRLNEALAAANLSNRHGLIKFQNHGARLAQDEAAFFQEFASLIRAHPDSHELTGTELRSNYPTLGRHLERLFINATDAAVLDDPWECIQCTAGNPGLLKQELEACLNAKTGLAQQYRANVRMSRLGLLIVAAGMRMSECAGLDFTIDNLIPQVRPVAQALSFDEIYFYSRDGHWIRRLI
jgi:hypothetical protein